jgi:glycosyltransferase involved in cell wall biosynthesis
MRAGLVIYGSLSTISGGYLYDRQLVNQLRRAGWVVDILSLPWRNYPSHLSDNLRVGWAHKIADAGYDILLQDELNHPSLFWLNRVLRHKSSTPIISIVHHLRASEAHPTYLMPIYRAIEQSYLRALDGVICNSHTTHHNVEQLAQRAIPCTVAYPAADHRAPPSHTAVVDAISKRLAANAPLQLIFVGNLMPRKGLHTVLDALARLQSRHWHLHIVGSEAVNANYSAAMRQRAAKLSLTPNITWHGRVSDTALAALFLNSNLLTMPSYEGFGIVFLEAMGYGVPVLAADLGAAPEIIRPGINGELVSPEDSDAFCAKLGLLMHNPVHLATLAIHARLRYEAHPTWATSMGGACEWLRANYI